MGVGYDIWIVSEGQGCLMSFLQDQLGGKSCHLHFRASIVPYTIG